MDQANNRPQRPQDRPPRPRRPAGERPPQQRPPREPMQQQRRPRQPGDRRPQQRPPSPRPPQAAGRRPRPRQPQVRRPQPEARPTRDNRRLIQIIALAVVAVALIVGIGFLIWYMTRPTADWIHQLYITVSQTDEPFTQDEQILVALTSKEEVREVQPIREHDEIRKKKVDDVKLLGYKTDVYSVKTDNEQYSMNAILIDIDLKANRTTAEKAYKKLKKLIEDDFEYYFTLQDEPENYIKDYYVEDPKTDLIIYEDTGHMIFCVRKVFEK